MTTITQTIAKAIRTLGVAEVARRIELSDETVLRLAAGVRVHRGTMALAERHLARLTAGGG